MQHFLPIAGSDYCPQLFYCSQTSSHVHDWDSTETPTQHFVHLFVYWWFKGEQHLLWKFPSVPVWVFHWHLSFLPQSRVIHLSLSPAYSGDYKLPVGVNVSVNDCCLDMVVCLWRPVQVVPSLLATVSWARALRGLVVLTMNGGTTDGINAIILFPLSFIVIFQKIVQRWGDESSGVNVIWRGGWLII